MEHFGVKRNELELTGKSLSGSKSSVSPFAPHATSHRVFGTRMANSTWGRSHAAPANLEPLAVQVRGTTMFRGSYEAKITEGRLKLPSDFEKPVIASNVRQFYVTSVDGKSAEIWPLPDWEKREAKLAEHSTMDDAVAKYLNLTSYYGQQVEMDKQARISLPKILRGTARLEGEVMVMGKLSYLEVINSQALQETITAGTMSKDERNKVAAILGPAS